MAKSGGPAAANILSKCVPEEIRLKSLLYWPPSRDLRNYERAKGDFFTNENRRLRVGRMHHNGIDRPGHLVQVDRFGKCNIPRIADEVPEPPVAELREIEEHDSDRGILQMDESEPIPHAGGRLTIGYHQVGLQRLHHGHEH